MPTETDPTNTEVGTLLAQTLETGQVADLEAYLAGHSHLPGPRANLPLIGAVAEAVGAVVTRRNPPVKRLEALLDGWAALPLAAAPVNDPREILPATAMLTYGQVAVVRPDWWDDEIAKLRRGAADPRWRTREMVASALQRMLAADWLRGHSALTVWLSDPDPLVVRAAVAGVAEPALLTDPRRGAQAVAIQERATAWLARLPDGHRRDADVRVLRQALGYTVSVAAAAAPEPGFALLERLAGSSDPDLQWIARENLKKHRLHPWAARVAAIRAAGH